MREARCHLVYSVPHSEAMFGNRLVRAIRRLLRSLGVPVGLLQTRRPSRDEIEQWPRRSPYENTKQLFYALNQVAPVRLYHLTEIIRSPARTADWFLGHPVFPYFTGAKGVTEIVAVSPIRPKIFALITPLHCRPDLDSNHINIGFLNHVGLLLEGADVLFAIMGEYWWHEWDRSPYAHWKPKMVRLDMAIDASGFPFLRHRFNPEGRRRYLYVGNNEERKGVRFLNQLFAQCSDLECGWIGNGPEMPHVKRISEFRPLTPEFVASVMQDYDFFISPSLVDPNPTTILESMAWGLPVLCTPQSGYYETEFRLNIYSDDLARSEAALRRLQHESETNLLHMSKTARRVVEENYSWADFTGRVVREMEARSVHATG